VTPILAGNYLPSFTDHSVDHSDCLWDLVDQLATPLPQGSRLSNVESFVLYAACYLHDVGLQHQVAGGTQAVRAVLERPEYRGRHWSDLSDETRRQIVRGEHHRISGEMVRQSVDAPQPTLVGIQLTEEWHPGQIASLCEAHCLDTTDAKYRELTQDWGSVRMSLLSALLRLADILDESRRRSQLYLERTRELDLEERMHWWRHYYVADIQIDPQSRHIILWFDFPPDRRLQYRDMITPLQVPWIEVEFARHDAILASYSLHWHFRVDESPPAQSRPKAMDNELERYILEKHAKQREQQAERDRLVLLAQLKVARPTIQRSLTELRARAVSMSADEQLGEFMALSKHLWHLGGRRDAWMTFHREYAKLKSAATPAVRLAAALDLADMMLQDDASSQSVRLLHDLRAQADVLSDGDDHKYRYRVLLAHSYLEQCAYQEAVAELSAAARLAPDAAARAKIEAELAEARLLHGDLDQVDLDKGTEGNP